MGIKVVFNQKDEDLIRDGYESTHHRRYDEDKHAIRYESIALYLKAGKKVRRQRAIKKFFDEWGTAIFWVVAIGGFAIWSFASHHHSTPAAETNYSHSSTSGIYQADSCAITTCNDGACSTSTGRGTCSHHGGVKY